MAGFEATREANFAKRRKILAALLKEARKECALTQKTVAEAVGYSQYDISRIETGERGVDFIEVEMFARLYKRELADFATYDKVARYLSLRKIGRRLEEAEVDRQRNLKWRDLARENRKKRDKFFASSNLPDDKPEQ